MHSTDSYHHIMVQPTPLPTNVEGPLFYKALIVILQVAAIIGLGLAPKIFGVDISLFIACLTLVFEAALVSIIACRWQNDITSLEFFQFFGGALVTWGQVELTVTVFLGTINFWSFVLLTRLSMVGVLGGYFFLPGVATALIIFIMVVDAVSTKRLSSTFDADDYTQI